MNRYYSNGKLLLTGEYVVLDGALALAVPTKYGQSMLVNPQKEKSIHWSSLDEKNQTWLGAKYVLRNEKIDLEECFSGTPEIADNLLKILNTAHDLNPEILSGSGCTVLTKLDFPTNWGLGSSSTLINNIAAWFGIDAYILLEKTFGGSGYDIAAAQKDHPVTYQLLNSKRRVLAAAFDPDFKDELFFVHLNRKQNSRESIAHYKQQSPEHLAEAIEKISALTNSYLQCKTITEFELLIEIHETIISGLINTPKIKSALFPDYPGSLKSLGGWGGDFIMATGAQEHMGYFRSKGYETIIPYVDLVLSIEN